MIIKILVLVSIMVPFYGISAEKDTVEDIQAVMSELQQPHVVITPIKMRNAIVHKHHRTLMLYIKHGANVHDSSQLIMPLFCAALHCNEIALVRLLKAGSQIGRLDKQGNTFFDYLVAYSQCSSEETYNQMSVMVSIAWCMGADLTVCNITDANMGQWSDNFRIHYNDLISLYKAFAQSEHKSTFFDDENCEFYFWFVLYMLERYLFDDIAQIEKCIPYDMMQNTLCATFCLYRFLRTKRDSRIFYLFNKIADKKYLLNELIETYENEVTEQDRFECNCRSKVEKYCEFLCKPNNVWYVLCKQRFCDCRIIPFA